MTMRRSIRDNDDYHRALERARKLSGVPLGSDDPRAAELDEWLCAIEDYEETHGVEPSGLNGCPPKSNGSGR